MSRLKQLAGVFTNVLLDVCTRAVLRGGVLVQRLQWYVGGGEGYEPRVINSILIH